MVELRKFTKGRNRVNFSNWNMKTVPTEQMAKCVYTYLISQNILLQVSGLEIVRTNR